MVHPGAFKGLRKDFLLGEKAYFSAAMEGGSAKDALAIIQRRFFKRFPLSLPQDTELPPEHLAAVDDDKPDEEPEGPDKQVMTAEEYNAALKDLEDRQKLLQFRRGVSDLQPDMAIPVYAKNKLCHGIANQTLANLPVHERQQL